ncbi:MAG: hypothetical protein RJA07_949 [Bacteroidota bacterium]
MKTNTFIQVLLHKQWLYSSSTTLHILTNPITNNSIKFPLEKMVVSDLEIIKLLSSAYTPSNQQIKEFGYTDLYIEKFNDVTRKRHVKVFI